jgi:hypothetical protein
MTFESPAIESLSSNADSLSAFRAMVAPTEPSKPMRSRGDFARSSAGKVRRNDRRARIAAKAAWLNS